MPYQNSLKSKVTPDAFYEKIVKDPEFVKTILKNMHEARSVEKDVFDAEDENGGSLLTTTSDIFSI